LKEFLQEEMEAPLATALVGGLEAAADQVVEEGLLRLL